MYREFVKVFGPNPELYKQLKSLKDDSELSWEEVSKLKAGNFDLENKRIKAQQN